VYEKEANGLERYATNIPLPRPATSYHHHDRSVQYAGAIQHAHSVERMKFNNSPYPQLSPPSPNAPLPHHAELESRSPPTSPPCQAIQRWHSASELHSEDVSVGSPVSDLEGLSQVVRMNGVELDAGEFGKGKVVVGTNF
jgi:hypothetical protein